MPHMRPAKKDFKTEKQYIERTKHFYTQWTEQTPEWYKYSEVQMPTKPKGKQLAKKPPVVTKAPLVAKAMVVKAHQVATPVPQVATPVVAKQAASKALEVIAPAAKRPCPSDNLQNTTPEGKLLAALKVPMSADSVVKAFSLPGQNGANSLLYKLKSAGKIKLVSGWGFSPGSTGKPMWQVVV